jgi:CO/xanthine dehydrogenase Mo-binding subunit
MAGSAVWLASKDLVERLTGSMDQTEPIESTATYQFTAESFPFATSAALVEVDVELCTVRLVRYVVAADLGTVINPMLVRGQLAGAAVLGCGGALLEELSYDTDGQPMSTSFMDYLLPSSLDVPAIETILMDTGPATTNPLGVRGAGEIGTPGAGAAIANAVADALGPSAAPLTSLPLSPDRLLDLVTVGTDKHMSPDIG